MTTLLSTARSLVASVLVTALAGCATGPSGGPREPANALPVRGLHIFAPAKKDVDATLAFIRDVLPREGVNTLIVEFNYGFDFRSRPEFAAPWAPDRADVRRIARACREQGIELIPMINCLGHQSWSKGVAPLLDRHPEFDETPGKFTGNKDIYCRSYCPLHPELHAVLFDLIDELASAARAKSFHVGMDEVFILADPACPRCKGRDPAELFAGEVTRLRDHLASIGCRMWMWGDRFLDGRAKHLGKWEGSENGTAAAIERVPKDVVICDWHYDAAPATPDYFAARGFDVVACPWRKPAVALAQLERIRAIRAGPDPAIAAHARGLVQTTWVNPTAFFRACAGAGTNESPSKLASAESAACFRKLAAAWRDTPPVTNIAPRR